MAGKNKEDKMESEKDNSTFKRQKKRTKETKNR